MIYNYFREYWNRYHKVTFDGPNKLILINEGVTEIDVQVDIYSDWKEWMISLDHSNTRWLEAAESVGGNPLPGARSLGSTFFLVNGWRIKPYPGSYRLTVTGNLYTDTGENPYISADVLGTYPNNIFIEGTVSNLIDTVEVDVPSLDADQIQQLAQEVWKQTLSLYVSAGTTGEALNFVKNNAALIPALV